MQSSPGPRPASEATPQQPRPVTAAELPSQTPAQTPTVAPITVPTPAAPSRPSTQSVLASGSGSASPQIQLSDLRNILSGLGEGAGSRLCP